MIEQPNSLQAAIVILKAPDQSFPINVDGESSKPHLPILASSELCEKIFPIAIREPRELCVTINGPCKVCKQNFSIDVSGEPSELNLTSIGSAEIGEYL